MTKTIEFEEALEDDDWGLIISSEGKLKGLFIPDGKDEEEVPAEILVLCRKYFGIDVHDDVYSETMH
jgi:hypothetical protein